MKIEVDEANNLLLIIFVFLAPVAAAEIIHIVVKIYAAFAIN
jgi:type III secretory pathway component EscS